jgi:tight adherence protein C
MAEVSNLTYALVFLVVVAAFLVAKVLVGLPPLDKENFPGLNGFPPLYKSMLPILAWAADNFGESLARHRPERTETIRRQLLMAGYSFSPSLVYAAQIVLCAGGLLTGLLLFALTAKPAVLLWLGGLLGFFGWFYPPMTLESDAQKRQAAIIRALPFAIDLIGSAMHAGLDFNAAVRYYTSIGLKDPLTVEFGVMLRESELGKGRLEALQAMAERVQTQTFTVFVDAVAHAIEVGASLVGTIKTQGEDMRKARFALAEQKAARAPSIMILPMALFIMPAVFIIVLVPVVMRLKSSGV